METSNHRKHPLEEESNELILNNNNQVIEREVIEDLDTSITDTRGKSKRLRNNDMLPNDINVTGQHEEDELDQLQEGDNESSGDDHYIDPALKGPSRSRRNRIPESITVREAPPDFASNTGNFRALPSTSTDSGRNVVGNALKFAASDYTHISQAIAHQPLAVNPSLQTVELMKKMAQAALPRESEVDRMSAFMTEVSNQLFNISQRIDVLETGRFASLASMTTLQSTVSKLENSLALSADATASAAHHMLTHHLDQAHEFNSHDLSGAAGVGPLTNSNPISDAANIANAEQLQAIFHNHFATTNGQFAQDIVASSSRADISTSGVIGGEGDTLSHDSTSSTSAAPKAKRGRKVGSVNTPKDPSINQQLNILSADAKKKGRKPELSRAVRSTMFRMLGLSLSTNASKYHGYTSSPDLPEFNPAVLFDPNTGNRLWRWEWDKTLRQSAHNAAFSMAIQNQILSDRNGSGNTNLSAHGIPMGITGGLYSDVPEQDWNSLDEAVESAFTNLRRERESQLDPLKKQKKDDHRKKGKKKGAKDEKCKRRKLALKDSRIRGIVAGDIENSTGVRIGGSDDLDGSIQESEGGWLNILSSFAGPSNTFNALSGEEEKLEDALDMKYMSSEEEIDTNDPVNLNRVVVDVTPGATNSLVAGEKTYSVHAPAWRSDRFNRAIMELDILKPPEKVARRIVGGRRIVNPPEGVKDWMIAEDWVDLPNAVGRSSGVGKGKGKARARRGTTEDEEDDEEDELGMDINIGMG